MKKRVFAMLLVLAMVVASLTGCTGGNTESSKTESSKTESSKTESSKAESSEQSTDLFNKEGLPIVNGDYELSVFQGCRDADDIDWANLWYYQQLEEKTGIHVNFDVAIESDWPTKLNLMFASGEYNDVIMSHYAVDYEDYGVSQGVLLPMDDLIAEYMPIYSERIAQEPGLIKGLVASDGKMYAAGHIVAQDIHCGNMIFINKLWMDNLGLTKMPETVDELTEILRAFRDGDADGDGDATNEVPYEVVLTDFWQQAFSFWGIPETTNYVSISDDGQVRFNATMDGYREALEWMHMLYTEGLVDPEVLTQDGTLCSSKITDGRAGLIGRWRLLNHSIDEVKDNYTLLVPVHAEGYTAKYPTTQEVASAGSYITVACEHPEIAARWFDCQLETQTAYEMYYGPEGTTWNYNKDGLVELVDGGDREGNKWAPGVNTTFYGNAEWYFSTFNVPDFRLEKAAYDDVYEEAGVYEKYPYDTVTKLLVYTTEQNDQKNLLQVDLKSLVDNMIANSVLNGVTDADWDTFQTNLKNAGVEDYVKIFQDAFDTYQANNK